MNVKKKMEKVTIYGFLNLKNNRIRTKLTRKNTYKSNLHIIYVTFIFHSFNHIIFLNVQKKHSKKEKEKRYNVKQWQNFFHLIA